MKPAIATWIRHSLTTVSAQIDRTVGRSYLWLLLAVLSGSLIAQSDELITRFDHWNNWLVAEWLIDYSGGFTRRGLGGEIIFSLADWTGIGVQQVGSALIIGILATSMALIVLIAARKRLTFWWVALALSPLAFPFHWLDLQASARKEWLFILLLASWCLLLAKRKTVSNGALACFVVATALIMLIHESLVLYSPYFVVAAWIGSHQNRSTTLKSLALVGTCAVIVIALAYWGARIPTEAICAHLVSVSGEPNICHGTLAPFYETVSSSRARLIQHLSDNAVGHYLIMVAVYLISVTPVLFMACRRPGPALAITGALIVCTLPLYFITLDWGRWLNIHAIMFCLCALLALKDKSPAAEPASATNSVMVTVAGVLTVIIIVTINSSWRLRHCCADDWIDNKGAYFQLMNEPR